MHRHSLLISPLLLIAALAFAPAIEGSGPLPPEDPPPAAAPVPADPVPAEPPRPAEPPSPRSPITRVLRGVMRLGQSAPKVEVTAEMRAAIDAAILDLAADDYHVRESAATRLMEIGYPALAALKEAGESKDAEVRFRAKQLFTIVQSRVMFDSQVLSGHEDIVWTVAYSHTGRLLASGGGGRHNNGQWSPGSDFAIRLWDPATQRVIRTIPGHTSTINRVAWSMSDGYVLSASSDGTARIWRVKDGSEFRIFRGHEGPVSQALFSPDEKQIITASWDKTIRIWDVKTGKELRRIDWPEGRVWGLDLSPDGELLAACGDTPIVRLYHYHDGKLAGELKQNGHASNAVTLAFSPGGRQLATGGWDNSARIWDVKERKFLRAMTDHTARIEGLAWSGDGQYLVTGCLDSKVRVYDAAKGVLARAYEGHSQSVSKVSVSPQGDAIASAGWDGDIRLWPTTGIATAALGAPTRPAVRPAVVPPPDLPLPAIAPAAPFDFFPR